MSHYYEVDNDDVEEFLPVDRCVCFSTTFADMKVSGATSVEELRDLFGCTSACGLCKPYIQQMLLTGETRFAVLPPEF